MLVRSVLVVDDDEDYRSILTAALGHAGFATRTARRREEVLEAASLAPPDLLLLSLDMAELDGWALVRELKLHRSTRSIPVLAVTLKHTAASATALRRAGFCGRLYRPFLPRQAVEAVHLCLDGAETGGAWVILPPFDLPPPPLVM